MREGKQRKDECMRTLSQEEKETEGQGMKRKRNTYEVNGLKAQKGKERMHSNSNIERFTLGFFINLKSKKTLEICIYSISCV